MLNALIGAIILSPAKTIAFCVCQGLLLGLALIAAGVYEKKVRDPKVIIISGSHLEAVAGIFALGA